MALKLVDQVLIDQFTDAWPSPQAMAIWIQKKWVGLIKGKLSHYFCSRGFYTFFLETKEDENLIFRSGPYFYGTKGLYLKRGTLDFNTENGIPSTIFVWVRLPHLSLQCWNDDVLRSI
jgi:hypothetical protein